MSERSSSDGRAPNPLWSSSCPVCSGPLRVGTVRIRGGRDGASAGIGLELAISERLVVGGRDIDAPEVPIIRHVVIDAQCPTCGPTTAVRIAEDGGQLVVAVQRPGDADR